MNHKTYIKTTVQAALENIIKRSGGPFAAMVVKDHTIISMGTNEVTTSNDPTAHAEVQAIRKACEAIGSFQLKDCILYTSCEPCPMCLGAIYWARLKEVYYCFTREQAANSGFDDAFIYKELQRAPLTRSIPGIQVPIPLTPEENPFLVWTLLQDKIDY